MDKNGENTNTTPVPNPVGRPSKYDPSMAARVDEYLKQAKFPTVEGYGLFLGVDDDTVVRWANKRLKDENGNPTKKLARPEFYAAVKRVKTLQKERLMIGGLGLEDKPVNATMAIFLLKANHGFVETQYIDHTTKGKELPTPLLGGVTNVHKDNSAK